MLWLGIWLQLNGPSTRSRSAISNNVLHEQISCTLLPFLLLHIAYIQSFAMLSFLTLCFSLAAVTLASQCNFKLELTVGRGSPDGYERDMIFINGQYPGPLLEINQDDWVEIEVVNNMPFNSSIHYHGQSYITLHNEHSADLNRNTSNSDSLVRWCTWTIAKTHCTWRFVHSQVACRPVWQLLLPRSQPWSNR